MPDAAASALFGIVLLLLAAERFAELVINRRNTRRLADRGAVWLGRDGFRAILAAQLLFFGLLMAEVGVAPWVGIGPWTGPLLGLAVLAQALRYWCIATLGERWSIRVVTVPGAPRIVRGPYRWFPHPNYVAVAVEPLVIPLAFGAWVTALVVVPVTLLVLRRRIRIEERALGEAQAAPPAVS